MRTRSSNKQNKSAYDPAFDEQKQLVLPELQEAIGLEDDTFIRSLYHHIASELAIDTFLKKSRFYSLTQRRWKLPRSTTKLLDNNFCTPFLRVFSSILKHFGGDSLAQGTREVVDTRSTWLQHCEVDAVDHHSCPSLVIRAEGPSFELPKTTPGKTPMRVGYSNITSCIEIQVHGNEVPISDQLVRVGIYARQIFIHQPNRIFVRVLLISESHIRLFHSDRSGAQYTPLLDFHNDPQTFVRLVLGLSSLEELDVGLDASIQWIISSGRKIGGTIRTRGTDDQDKIYQLAQVNPCFFRGQIAGRSTICWSVIDPVTSERLLVKDLWREDDRPSEHTFLENAIGLPGVVQMVDCDPDRYETRSLRGLDGNLPTKFSNRIESRIVMKAYGNSIARYTSAQELLYAIRDAIAGHMELFRKGMLHRDVSPYNVLFGNPGAEPGYRGILIDFDISILRKWKKLVDSQIGTRLYQSVAVLSSGTVPDPLPHDHLDDLESFIYVLVQIIFTQDSNGVAYKGSNMISRWEEASQDCDTAATLKEAYLSREVLPNVIGEHWPSPCVDLVLALSAFICPLMGEKMKLNQLSPRARKGKEQMFAADAIQHYSRIIQLFDTAIEALEKPDTWRVPSPDVACADPISSGSTSTDSVPVVVSRSRFRRFK
ncbi:hypothetical protein MD484_g6093, partial [Candolleomyces efflorescens]